MSTRSQETVRRALCSWFAEPRAPRAAHTIRLVFQCFYHAYGVAQSLCSPADAVIMLIDETDDAL
jgi:hypothetical protein